MAPRRTVRIGTSGWSYPSGEGTWNGLFYPPRGKGGFKAGDELGYYAEHFDTVEVNSTFYRPPDDTLVRRWVKQTPAGFEFSVKLYQGFTHPMMQGRGSGSRLTQGGASTPVPQLDPPALEGFKRAIEPMAAAGRLGMLLAQFPASFHDTLEARGYLAALLQALRGYPVAVELRHRSWSDRGEAVVALLDEFDATWVAIDEPKFASSIRQRPVPHGGAFYMRLHGRNAANWWVHESPDDRYNYLYSPGEMDEFGDALERIQGRVKKAYVYLNNHFSAKAVVNATVLKHHLGQAPKGEYRAELLARYPELAEIVRAPGPKLFE